MREYKKGGYVILDLESTTIYTDALKAIQAKKPVVVYDEPNIYFADTIKADTIDDDAVVIITKGGKTITITDVNSVSSEGEIQPSGGEGGSSVYVCHFLDESNQVTLTDAQKNELVEKITDLNTIFKFAKVDASDNVLVYSVRYGVDAGTGDILEYYMDCYFNGYAYAVKLDITTNELVTETP